MKILVCIKSVIDSNIKAKINNSSTGIDIMNSKMSINPFDEVAIEAAVSLKEANLKNNINTEIIALSIGMPKSQEALKIALAHGCDRAIFVNDDTINDDFENHLKHLSPIKIATIISHIAITENPELIFLGKLAIDDEASQVGQMLAGILNIPQATNVSQINYTYNITNNNMKTNDESNANSTATNLYNKNINVVCEIDNGTEELQITMPAVITTDLSLNEPRFIKLIQILAAKKKTIEVLKLSELQLNKQLPITQYNNKFNNFTQLNKNYIKIQHLANSDIKKNCKILDIDNEQDTAKLLKLLSANQQNDYEQFFDAHNFIKLFNQNNHANINTSNNYDNSPNPNMHGLIILEYDHNVTPHELIYKIYQLLTIFYKINASCDLLLLGANIQLDTLIINTIQQIKMIKQVFIIDHASLENIIIDNIAIQLAEFIIDNNYQHIISNTNSVANNLFPRLGGILGSDTLTDVTDIVNYNTFRRFIYAANIIATIELLSPYKLLTVNTTIIDLEKFYNNHNSNDNINNIDYDNKTINNIIKKINYIALNYHDNKHIKFIKKSYTNTKINLYNTDLNSAKLIVSGGASLQSKENFNNIIVNFAHQIHAAVGATRAAVEAGLISNEHQVGQTGKKVAPDVYLAVGISGAVQHLSGMKNAKIVIAINCDKNATIFEYSDYGIIGDLFNIMPKLSNIIKTSKT